jgi:bacterioferritin-associated ferredoxin
MKYRAELKGRDLLEIDTDQSPAKLKVIGCSELLQLARSLKAEHGEDPLLWPIPKGTSHGEILLREVLLKAKNQWTYPYEHVELCHCRAILTEEVDQAILSGAHSPEKVSRVTSASTACGTCRGEVERIIEFRLKSA